MEDENPRVVAIGDIHGQDHLLEPLLSQIEAEFIDRRTSIVFLGDYINRTPDPEKCRATLSRIQEFERKYPRQTFLLRGNHEWNYIQTIEYEIDHLEITKDWELLIYHEFSDLLRSTMPYYENETHFFSHAGGVLANGTLTRKEKTEDDLYALYWRYELPDKPYEKIIVRAHKIVEPDQVFGNHVITIDLGSYKTGKLGAVVLPDNITIVSE